MAFWIARGDALDKLVPIFVVTTIFTASVGPGSVWFAYRLAHPDIKKHRSWFWEYLFFSVIIYTEVKNIIGRVAQLKQAMGETSWRVTPRSADPADRFPDVASSGGLKQTSSCIIARLDERSLVSSREVALVVTAIGSPNNPPS